MGVGGGGHGGEVGSVWLGLDHFSFPHVSLQLQLTPAEIRPRSLYCSQGGKAFEQPAGRLPAVRLPH
jgi:hypothetical protein